MRFLPVFLASFIAASAALGQGVTVDVSFDQEYYLAHESLIAKVRIVNFSGRTLRFGQDTEWISFNIEGEKHFVVRRLSPILVDGEFELQSAQAATKHINIAPFFDLSRAGHYRITATLSVRDLKLNIDSPPAGFDIMSGSKLWEHDFGLPPQDPSDTLEVRRYALIQTIHQRHLKLYIRVSNSTESKIYKVFPVGPMVSFSKPEPQLDKYSNLHILYQTGARSFNYTVVNPDALIICRETYDYTESRPHLKADGDGRLHVQGGIRRASASDLPPPSTSQLLDTK